MFISNFNQGFVQRPQPYIAMGQPIYRPNVLGQPQYHSYVPPKPVAQYQQPRVYSYQPQPIMNNPPVANRVVANTTVVKTTQPVRKAVVIADLFAEEADDYRKAVARAGLPAERAIFELKTEYPEFKSPRFAEVFSTGTNTKKEGSFVAKQDKQADSTGASTSDLKIKTAANLSTFSTYNSKIETDHSTIMSRRRKSNRYYRNPGIDLPASKFTTFVDVQAVKAADKQVVKKEVPITVSQEIQAIMDKNKKIEEEINKLRAIRLAKENMKQPVVQQQPEAIKAPIVVQQAPKQMDVPFKPASNAPIVNQQQPKVESRPASNTINYANPQQVVNGMNGNNVYGAFRPAASQNVYAPCGFANQMMYQQTYQYPAQYPARFAMPAYAFGHQGYSQVPCF